MVNLYLGYVATYCNYAAASTHERTGTCFILTFFGKIYGFIHPIEINDKLNAMDLQNY